MINVLMVDGNLNHLNVVSQYFNTNKKIKVVKHALTGTEALKIIEEDNDSIDVIVLDLILSGKDGFSIIEYVNKNFPNINIIVNTSYNEEKTIRRIASKNWLVSLFFCNYMILFICLRRINFQHFYLGNCDVVNWCWIPGITRDPKN